MNSKEAEQKIKEIVIGRLGKYVSNFSLTINSRFVANKMMWTYSCSFECSMDKRIVSFSDGTEPGDVNDIIERIIGALLDKLTTIEYGKREPIEKHIKDVGESLGFTYPVRY